MRRDDALLAFAERVAHDSEFREWFAQSPDEALASSGLRQSDLSYLDAAVGWGGYNQPEVAAALKPFVQMLVETAGDRRPEPDQAYARLTAAIGELRDRIAEARAKQQARHAWWKFWQW